MDTDTAAAATSKTQHTGAIALIIILGFAVYFNSLRNEFVYDDIWLIRDNQNIKDLGDLTSLFSTPYWPNVNNGLYRPLASVSFAINYAVGRLDPFGYHLANVTIHLANSVLVYLLCLLLSKKWSVSFLSGLLFATHPVHTESVTWVTGRSELLCGAFSLLSLILHVGLPTRPARRKTRVCYVVASSVLFFLALLSKETAVVLPLAFALIDCVLLRETGAITLRELLGHRLKTYFPPIVAVGIYMILRLKVLGSLGPTEEHRFFHGNEGTTVILLNTAYAFLTHARLLLWPHELSVDHTYSLLDSMAHPLPLISIGFLIAAMGMFVFSWRRSRMAFFAIGVYLIFLLPVSNIIPIEVLIAERFLYLPSIGFCVLLAGLMNKMLRLEPPGHLSNASKVAAVMVIAALPIFYSVITVKQNRVWKNAFSLWSHTIDVNPMSYKAHFNLGVYFMDNGMIDQEIDQYERALEIRPDYLCAVNNLGHAYQRRGLHKEAAEEYRKAISINPSFWRGHHNLGTIYQNMGLFDEALRAYKDALRYNPGSKDTLENIDKIHQLRDSNPTRGMADQKLAGDFNLGLGAWKWNPREWGAGQMSNPMRLDR